MLTILMIKSINEKIPVQTLQSVEYLGASLLIDSSINSNLGKRKRNLLKRVVTEWVLVIDTDEIISPDLLKELENIIRDKSIKYNGYKIPYQNYAFGHEVNSGGEKFSKTRLFKNNYGSISNSPIHEEVYVKGRIGQLKGKILHYSYRTARQVFTKFTKYAWLAAGQKKKEGEHVTLKKLTMYGPHMFWARAIKDQGYRDGWRGIVLALFFAYMEGLTYWLLLFRSIVNM